MSFRFLLVTISATMAPLCLSIAVDENLASTRPNILLICVDDMNDMIGVLGGPAITPHLDALAGRGLNFTNAHVAATYCTPSRTAFLTGQYPSRTGCYTDEVYFQKHPNLRSLPRLFKEAGYHVAGGGKVFHHMPGYVELHAFHEFFLYVEENKRNGWKSSTWDSDVPLPPGQGEKGGFSEISRVQNYDNFDIWAVPDDLEESLGDTITANWAADFVGREQDKPFFLAFGTYAPHKPNYAPQKYFDLYPLESLERPLGFREGDLDDVPGAEKRLRGRIKRHRTLVENGFWEEAMQGYLASVSYADAMVGRVLDALAAGPHSGDTLVVFWSDHGYHLGEKEVWGKHTLWQRTTGIPFLWSGPGIPAGQRHDGAVSAIDTFPTLLELAGIDPPEGQSLDGKSLVPVFDDPAAKTNRVVYTVAAPDEWSAVSAEWRYIHNGTAESGELYRLDRDPHEWRNLLAKPGNKERFSPVIDRLSRNLPANPLPSEAWKARYRLELDGESFRWVEKRAR